MTDVQSLSESEVLMIRRHLAGSELGELDLERRNHSDPIFCQVRLQDKKRRWLVNASTPPLNKLRLPCFTAWQ